MSASKSEMTIAIVGGGLGGVCAAIALGRAGYTGQYGRTAYEP
jgi:cation diffusion facilitator CzcD-associated flavoprotein CzcO